jgi:hypothetical protein
MSMSCCFRRFYIVTIIFSQAVKVRMNQLTKISLPVLAVLASMAFMPAVYAAPINSNLVWSPDPTSQGGTSTATFGVNDVTTTGASDPDCPAGDTFSGTLTVVEHDGISTSTVSVGATPCGTTNLTAVYPTQFTGVAGTTECGVYSATWAGTTTAVEGGIHPTFSVSDHLSVSCGVGVPEFQGPAIMVAALGLLLLATVKKVRLVRI